MDTPAKIIPFPGVEFIDQGPNEQPQKDVIEVLETWLEKAETGELQSVAITGSLPDTSVLLDYATGTGPTRQALVSGCAELQQRILGVLIADGEEDEDEPDPQSA